MNKRLILKVHGMVHGVGYRYSAQREAKKRGFTGYVLNLDDGTVGIVAEGEEKDLKSFVTRCYNGVEAANVSKVDQNWSKANGEFSDFVIRF